MDWGKLWHWTNAALDGLDEVNWPLLILAVIAVLQFVYLDVAVAIASLPRLIVFVLGGGEPPV